MKIFIKDYPKKTFLQLGSKEQNKTLYNEYPKASRSTIRNNKKNILDRKIVKSVQKKIDKKQTTKKKDPPLSHLSADTSRQGDKPGTPLEKLTEEILEDALVKALRDDPTRALNPALAFLDKKKGLSVSDDDTNQTLIAQDKLKTIRKDMFSWVWCRISLHGRKGRLSRP